MKSHGLIFCGNMVLRFLAREKTMTRRLVTRSNTLIDGGKRATAEHWTAIDLAGAFAAPGRDGIAPHLEVACREHYGEGHWLYPQWAPGDEIWVKETFYCDHAFYPNAPIAEMTPLLDYRATHDCDQWEAGCPCRDDSGRSSWRSPLHMPRWASRIIRVVREPVRPERLQDISEADAKAEGFEEYRHEHWSAYDPRTQSYPEFNCDPTDDVLESVRHHPDMVTTAAENFRYLWQRLNAKRSPWERNDFVWVIAMRAPAGEGEI